MLARTGVSMRMTKQRYLLERTKIICCMVRVCSAGWSSLFVGESLCFALSACGRTSTTAWGNGRREGEYVDSEYRLPLHNRF
jgi:hypothetical protein